MDIETLFGFQNYSAVTWIILYFAAWILAIVWSVIFSRTMPKEPKKGSVSARDLGVLAFAFFAGIVAASLVIYGLKVDLRMVLLPALACGTALVYFSSTKIGDKLRERQDRRSTDKK